MTFKVARPGPQGGLTRAGTWGRVGSIAAAEPPRSLRSGRDQTQLLCELHLIEVGALGCDATRFHLEDLAKAKGERSSCRRHHTLRLGEWTGMRALVRTLDDGAIALHGGSQAPRCGGRGKLGEALPVSDEFVDAVNHCAARLHSHQVGL